jgi:hypothetical protein
MGTFTIQAHPHKPGQHMLSFDGIHLSDCPSAGEAAADVYAQRTGWDKWDLLGSVSAPPDLSGWAEGEPDE